MWVCSYVHTRYAVCGLCETWVGAWLLFGGDMVGTGWRGGVGEGAGLGSLACFSGYFGGTGWEITCVCRVRVDRWMGIIGRCYGGDDAVVCGNEWCWGVAS